MQPLSAACPAMTKEMNTRIQEDTSATSQKKLQKAMSKRPCNTHGHSLAQQIIK
jgi:excinuclease UvrABC ATPase subunit